AEAHARRPRRGSTRGAPAPAPPLSPAWRRRPRSSAAPGGRTAPPRWSAPSPAPPTRAAAHFQKQKRRAASVPDLAPGGASPRGARRRGPYGPWQRLVEPNRYVKALG